MKVTPAAELLRGSCRLSVGFAGIPARPKTFWLYSLLPAQTRLLHSRGTAPVLFVNHPILKRVCTYCVVRKTSFRAAFTKTQCAQRILEN